jgi:hypothetical protein
MSSVLFVAMTVVLTAGAAWYFGSDAGRDNRVSGGQRHDR